ncbi:MAG: YebC/PmpR family DNA-binding transcriptional regulator [Candidatus Yanofskybacteria bacterium]|nr:YebC/PmpR family DNA-binding transcriptional regulator [Candidatus Yanofskybacteria bacterium]
MSGHSKWSQIKHKKGISDQKKGQLFSKLAKKISVAAREGMDPSTNYKLQSVIDEARVLNMPKDNIERAIKKAGDKDTTALNELVIQTMGPAGIALIIIAITDNKNRTVNEIKHILAEHEIKMVPENSLNWMFDKNWNPHAPIETAPEIHQKLDKLFEALDNNEDVENVYTNLAEPNL